MTPTDVVARNQIAQADLSSSTRMLGGGVGD